MTFVHLSLLAGAALIALPIVLHLVMRQRPVLHEFPALRFLQRRHETNQRRLQLRHLILLLLRAGVIALLAFALARPTLKWAGAVGSHEAPVAAVLVFDAAVHMEYRHHNQTRLEASQSLGLWLLAQLPENSEIGVMDTRLGTPPAFQADPGAARERIARLESVSNAQPLTAAIDSAVKLLKQSRLERKELYIFTDLSHGSWPEQQASRMQQTLGELGNLGIYVIDVGISNPTNFSLGELQLSGEVLSARSPLTISTTLSTLGTTEPCSVELYLLDDKQQPQKRSAQHCEPRVGELHPVEFRIGGLEPGIHQGFVKIVGQDGLAADHTRYFTFAVQPAWRILLAAPKPPQSYAIFLAEALAPELYRKRGQARFDCDICDQEALAKKTLNDYAAVFLLDPKPLEPAVWRKLGDYAAEGRGLAIILGRNAQPIDSFNDAQAQELLAGKLVRQVRRPDGSLFFSPRDVQHPILAAFRNHPGAVPWQMFPVFRYWQLTEPSNGTSVIIHYNDGRPAILERSVGRGRVLTATTSISDRPNEQAWNMLPIGEAWPFLILANQTATYLAGSGEQRWNYLAGQMAVLPLNAADLRLNYMLFTPDKMSYPVSADTRRRALAIAATDQVGNYRVRAGGPSRVALGFSVNYALDQTRLDRLTDKELSGMFGPAPFRMAQTREQIERDISTSRVGSELFPPLILLVALFLAAEMFVANRFYREKE